MIFVKDGMNGVLHRQAFSSVGQVRWLAMLLSPLLLAPQTASAAVVATAPADDTSVGLHSEKCETPGSDAAPASSLLQIAARSGGHDDTFGPGKCVALKRSITGSCVLSTRCHRNNISNTEFAFVCFNPGASMPHALHSFGRGGFSAQETFDTKVWCKTCISVDTAFRTGDSVVRNALAALPLSRLPSLSGAVQGEGVYSVQQLAQFKPKQAAVFGPEFCISTFRAPAGTCLIRTRCAGVDLKKTNVGVTCLDQSGGYTRYLFGKDSFKPEETFDTLVTCEKCLGVGPESSQFALHGLMPRKLVEDVNTLKLDVQTLREKVRVLQQHGEHESKHDHHKQHKHAKEEAGEEERKEPWKMPDSPSDVRDSPSQKAPAFGPPPMPSAPSKSHVRIMENDSGEAVTEPQSSEEPVIPTIMMSRRQQNTRDYEINGADVAREQPHHHTTSLKLQEAGAETAAIDVGDPLMQIVTHRRGNAIAELLRRVNVREPSGGAADEPPMPSSSGQRRDDEQN